jgi:hypothetical protein
MDSGKNSPERHSGYGATELMVRTPDVVEFAVSRQVGQAVLACPPAKLSPSKGMAQPIFPAGRKLRGDIRSSDGAGIHVVC